MRLTAVIALIPTLTLAEVPQGAPNASFAPAFAAQTRADAMAPTPVSVTRFARGLDAPWGITRLPSGQFVVTEKAGRMRIINTDGSVSAPLGGVPPVVDSGQGGLLDVAASPGFARDGVLFWTYAKPVNGGAATAAARGTLGLDGQLRDVTDFFVQGPAVSGGRHFGSRIVPAEDGTVWITTGDRGEGDSGVLVQDLDSTHGKVIRVRADGTIPADNPFVGSDGDDAIWSYGHRNVQGAALGPGGLWTVEHGPRGGDELNQPKAARNYGWPLVSYGINYRGSPVGSGKAVAEGLEPPVYYWDPVIAPSNMAFYDGSYAPWRGDILIGSLNPGGLVRLKMQGGRVVGEERLVPEAGRVRDVEVLPDGAVLLLTDDGDVLRVVPQ